MGKKQKSSDPDKTLKIIILVTALANLIKSIIDIIQKLI